MPDGKMTKKIEEGGYKYFGIMEVDNVKQDGMKGQIKKGYLRRVKISQIQS